MTDTMRPVGTLSCHTIAICKGRSLCHYQEGGQSVSPGKSSPPVGQEQGPILADTLDYNQRKIWGLMIRLFPYNTKSNAKTGSWFQIGKAPKHK